MRTIRVNFSRSCLIYSAILFAIYLFLVYKIYKFHQNQTKLSRNMDFYKYNYNESLAIHPGPEQNSTRFLINLTDFTFLRNNPEICYKNRLYNQLLLVLVHSARSNLEERFRIRQILGSFKTIKGWDIRLAFILGKKTSKLSENFTLESNDDLIVGNFEDTYRNLSYKHAMTYKWTVEFCPDAKFLVKIDDDVYINYLEYFQRIKEIYSRKNQNSRDLIACVYHSNSLTLRDPNSKNKVSFREYPADVYPRYCSGAGYLATMNAVRMIYKSSLKTKFFVVDDALMTGFLRIINKVEIEWFSSFENYKRVNFTKELHEAWRNNFARELYHDKIKPDLTIY